MDIVDFSNFIGQPSAIVPCSSSNKVVIVVVIRRGFGARDEEVNYRREGNEPQEPPVPPAVKDVARDEQQHDLRLQITLHDEPIQSEDDRQEEQEFRGVEEHGRVLMLENWFKEDSSESLSGLFNGLSFSKHSAL